jgi:hypothetical protein
MCIGPHTSEWISCPIWVALVLPSLNFERCIFPDMQPEHGCLVRLDPFINPLLDHINQQCEEVQFVDVQIKAVFFLFQMSYKIKMLWNKKCNTKDKQRTINSQLIVRRDSRSISSKPIFTESFLHRLWVEVWPSQKKAMLSWCADWLYRVLIYIEYFSCSSCHIK